MENQSISRNLTIFDLGLIDYKQAWDLQLDIHKKRRFNEIEDVLLICEHPHTYTLGKIAERENLLYSQAQLDEKNIQVYDIDRGGDITYHGPGQIVGYPIINLENWKKDTHLYLRALEEIMIKTCLEYGLNPGRNDKYTGVWIENRKICAIGIKVSRWVTMHGFAFNVNTDLSLFNGIIPCGIQEKSVTSLSAELKGSLDIDEVKNKVINIMKDVFEYNLISKGSNKEILVDFEKG
ncbi:MAG: lipoyl(octanoyl) transferase LipB [Melioribacteraceae bacterium]|nr:lipoyl(octanoyl) transferase LipB [Melioribacteraceae bacterium]